ncbi:anaphase-promoting complex subunit 1-like isoform X2 [Physella acuta]|uniref:anaphase-promoting complex subunit 1-like isoform X2 n=1 Tax=Physella acuta TaxID=109671 RepID=UPI0027DBF233|nr:anaphase-promoting complex subunit 1-like isoform X2 [Physella acuta]
MITACDTQDFVPFGREYLRRHPGQFQIKRKSSYPITDHGIPLIKSFKDICLHEPDKKESWVFRQHETSDSYDEELYVHGPTVIWSRGSQDSIRTLVKTFTMDSPVLQALWGSFILSSDKQTVDYSSTMGSEGQVQKGICVVESSTLSFFIEEGGEYSTPLPFQVSQTWLIKNGLLFERTLTNAEMKSQKKNCPSQTVIFSMLHPLDDIAPVITRVSGVGGSPKMSYLTDSSMTVIFTSSEPSLAFTYDCVAGVHSVWKIRRARQEEINTLVASVDNTSFLHMTPYTARTGHNLSASFSQHANASGTMQGYSNSSSFSPLRSFSGKVMSPGGILRSSPGVGVMATNRAQSPGVSGSVNSALYRFHTPPLARSPGRFLFSPGSGHNGSFGGNESFYMDPMASLQPNVCLEQQWSETNQPIRDGSLGKASKAFLSQDLCGQQYLCYMVPYKQHLRCLKFEESNDGSQLIFGSLTLLPAKDATSIEGQNMILILEISGVLVLYTGTTKISQVHIPIFSLGSGSISMVRSSTTPFASPVRGEVFTSSRPPSAMDVRFEDEMNHISPVSANLEDSSSQLDFSMGGLAMVTPGSCFIQNLRDNIGSKFTAELLNGSFCRTELPPMTTSPGIDLCLKALKHLLPKDIALQVLGRWYTVRNSPGGVGNVSEWSMFNKCILGMMGYDTGKLGLTTKGERDGSSSPVMHTKKAKPSDQGLDDDWDYLLISDHHLLSSTSHHTLGITGSATFNENWQPSRPCAINSSALLFPFCPAILIALHLVYEEMKLNILLKEELQDFAPLVHQIACDLHCTSYADCYQRDFPKLFEQIDDISQVTNDDLSKMQYPQIFPKEAPTVLGWITQALGSGPQPKPMPYLPLCENIKKVISVYSVLVNEGLPAEISVEKCLKKVAPAGHRAPTADTSLSFSLSKSFRMSLASSQAEKLVLTMTELDLTQRDIDCLPVGISVPMREACLICRSQPPSDWPQSAYILIGRQDLSELASLKVAATGVKHPESTPREREDVEKEDEDGMEHLDDEVLKLRFPKDLRLQEVRRLLQSARPVTIAIKQRPEVNDHDFIEEQEKALLATCVRTMALPVGRGIFTLHTCRPLLTETLPIPKLCLTGRSPPRNTTVDLTRIEVPTNMSVWPLFHNGVAAGLRIADSTQVESAWIIYNKPKELTNEFAGFLMALGLNGHLPNLCTFNIHEYISEGSELVTIGILLGMSAAKRGTMDQIVTKALSVHVSALLPPTSMELNIAHNTRVAAILGVGLLYQGTGHLHMAEVMLSEIGRPPGPEMENCVDRDSYALSAGLSLGLIMFGKGNQTMGLSDLSMADLLCHLMVGGHTKQMQWLNRDRLYKAPSFLIKEGDRVNVDVTSPGATLALGMIFFNTQNSAVSEWLKAPDTQFMLDQVRPDFLCLRIISYGLVNWDTILPTTAWLTSNIPEIVKKYAFFKTRPNDETELDSSIDLQTMSQAHCNITSGACLVLALKFAGSANKEAFKTLLDSLGSSMKMLGDQTLLDQAGRSTVENCISIKLLSLAIVMAGTGDLVTLRICRALRRRVGSQYHQFTYGNHMCTAMATGLLFLGGGKFTLKTTPEAVGAMLCAFYPQFPLSSTDNRYHLQAFRHLYVLACEPRLVIPRDVDTGRFCFVPLRIKFKGCQSYKPVSFNAGAPYIVPELNKLEEIQVLGARYWPITFREDKNWDTLKLLLQKGGILCVKQRAGHLSYTEDPKGYRSALAKSLIADNSCHFSSQPSVIKSFTSDAKITALAEFFLQQDSSNNSMMQALSSVIYQCVTQEKAEAICPHFILKHLSQQFAASTSTFGLQQLKLVMSYYLSQHQLVSSAPERLVQTEFLLTLRCQIERLLDQWLTDNKDCMLNYLRGELLQHHPTGYLAQYLVWFSFPSKLDIFDAGYTTCPPIPVLAGLLPHLHMAGLKRLHSFLTSR